MPQRWRVCRERYPQRSGDSEGDVAFETRDRVIDDHTQFPGVAFFAVNGAEEVQESECDLLSFAEVLEVGHFRSVARDEAISVVEYLELAFVTSKSAA